jgi:hypothetical protein
VLPKFGKGRQSAGSKRKSATHVAPRSVENCVDCAAGDGRPTYHTIVRPRPEAGAKSSQVTRLYPAEVPRSRAKPLWTRGSLDGSHRRAAYRPHWRRPQICCGTSSALWNALRGRSVKRGHRAAAEVNLREPGGRSLANTNECAMPPKSGKTSAMSRRILDGIV